MGRGVLEAIGEEITEGRALVALAILFLAAGIWVAATPYEPMDDLADATANDIWSGHYADGEFHVPLDEWTDGATQASVVMHDGEKSVVNEKGPGLALMLVPFHATGTELLFGPLMVLCAAAGTYILGKRLFGWPAGAVAAALTVANLTVVVMWHRYAWTDSATMHLAVLSLALAVEGVRQWGGGLSWEKEGTRRRALGASLCAVAGAVFVLAVSTRYPTALLLPVLVLTPLALVRRSPEGRWTERAWLRAKEAAVPLAACALGLSIALAPLLWYNDHYFGGPFASGYDADSLIGLADGDNLTYRNASEVWLGPSVDGVSVAARNLVELAPMSLCRMPVLVLAPVGLILAGRRWRCAALLALWIAINGYTFLSLTWVDRFSRPDLVAWEPRYWMPSLPAIAVLGAHGAVAGARRLVDWLVGRDGSGASPTAEEGPGVAHADGAGRGARRLPEGTRKGAAAMLALFVCAILLSLSIIPAAGYLVNPDVHEAQRPPKAEPLTVDDLLSDPARYVGQRVQVRDATVAFVNGDVVGVRGSNASLPALPVRLVEWPSGEIPPLAQGQRVSVEGRFVLDPAPPGAPPRYSVVVKYGTLDRIVPLP